MIGKGGLAAKIRVFTSGNVVLERYRRADAPGAPEAIASAEWILTSEEIFAGLGLTEWRCTTASSGPFADTSLGDVYGAVREGTIRELIRSRQTAMVLARRPSPSAQP